MVLADQIAKYAAIIAIADLVWIIWDNWVR